MNDRILTTDEVAEITKYSRGYIYQLAKRGLIPYHKPNGGKLFFLESEILEFIRRGDLENITKPKK